MLLAHAQIPLDYSRKVFLAVVGKPDGSMLLPDFITALCRLCYMFAAAKPRPAVTDASYDLQLLPQSLPAFVRDMMKRAQKDEMAMFRVTTLKTAEVQDVIAEHASIIESIGVRGKGQPVHMTLAMLKKLLGPLVRDVEVQRVSEITADPEAGVLYKSSLSELDIETAFGESLDISDEPPKSAAVLTLGQFEFQEALVRCANKKYAAVPMEPAARLAGLMANLRGEASETGVI
eukprot:2313810-Prymnesium_polylepis.1